MQLLQNICGYVILKTSLGRCGKILPSINDKKLQTDIMIVYCFNLKNILLLQNCFFLMQIGIVAVLSF